MGSLALDAQNYPHITYCNGTGLAGDGSLMYARWTGKIWDIQTVDSNFATGSGSISLDSNDKPHISYSGAYSSVFVDLAYLMYATATEPTQTPTPSPTQAPLLTVSAFSSWIILTLFTIAILAALVYVWKKKTQKRAK